MTQRDPRVSRRHVVAGLGSFAAAGMLPRPTPASTPAGVTRALQLGSTLTALRPDQSPSPGWGFLTTPPAPHVVQGDLLQVTTANGLPIPVAINWRGNSALQAEPLTVLAPVAPGQSSVVSLGLGQAGTMLCDARLLGDNQAFALPALAFSVAEKTPPQVDLDQVLLIEDWRLKPDGGTQSPGHDPGDADTVFTVNGRPSLDIATRTNDRLRLRFVNGCQRSVIAVKIDDHEVRVMAIDGQPAEPFIARNGQLMLAPGTRIDAFVDATGLPSSVAAIQLHDGIAPRPVGKLIYGADPARNAPLAAPGPLPGNGLPPRLDLRTATRINLSLDLPPSGTPAGWQFPAQFDKASKPAFRIKRGSIVVVALTNTAPKPVVFHMHGHHFRLLDQLDDGWKPFWLDTLLVGTQQTLRIAFAADHSGAWLLEAVATDWSAPRRAQWYLVD